MSHTAGVTVVDEAQADARSSILRYLEGKGIVSLGHHLEATTAASA